MKFTLLGAGLMGRAALYDLSRSTVVTDIVVADFDLARAESVANDFGNGKARAAFADVRDTAALATLLRHSAVVLNCTQYYWNLEVMRACIEAGTNYLDLGGLFHTTRKQLALDSEFRRIGRLALLGMGGTPGISNIAARYLSDRLDTVTAIYIYDGSTDLNAAADPLSSTFSIATVLDELTENPMHFANGDFHAVEPLSGGERIAFPKPIGTVIVRHSLHSEVATLPLAFRDKGVQEVFFKINYDPALIDSVRLLRNLGLTQRDPVTVFGNDVSPRAVLEALLRSRSGTSPEAQDIETIRVMVIGTTAGRECRLKLDFIGRFSTDAPRFSAVAQTTGFPASIAAQMIARGEIAATGVRAPEDVVPAIEFMRALEARNIAITGAGWRAAKLARKRAEAA